MKLDAAAFLDLTTGASNPGLALGGSDTDDMKDVLPILYAVAAGMRARNVLEIGTHDGTSTLALLRGVQLSNGLVTSVDAADCPVAHELVTRYEFEPHWRFLKGKSQDVLPLLKPGYDAILVDGDHSYEGCLKDLEEADRLLKPDGVLFTHDSWMLTSDHDRSKPFGERALRGCGMAIHEYLVEAKSDGNRWSGLILPFGCNLALWMRRGEHFKRYERDLQLARREGFLPARGAV